MRKLILAVSLVASVGVLSNTAAADELALAKKSGCLACHAIDKKIVGPAWKDVANRYKGQDAKADMIKKVKMGGKGSWTEVTRGVPMPPYSPRVTDENIEKLVDFILAL
ncbi:MAG: c-type cytochrome [Gammaproteobacteria bacterium]|nr:c-type cytochrome [Gammaproteobacteria bacterium]